jgi:hypothetical protein
VKNDNPIRRRGRWKHCPGGRSTGPCACQTEFDAHRSCLFEPEEEDRARETLRRRTRRSLSRARSAGLGKPDRRRVHRLPNRLHAEWTIRTASAGRHVMYQESMARDVAECHAMIDAVQQRGRALMIAHRLYFEEANLKASEHVRSGKIGEPPVFLLGTHHQLREGDIRINPQKGAARSSTRGSTALMQLATYWPTNPARHSPSCRRARKNGLEKSTRRRRRSSVHLEPGDVEHLELPGEWDGRGPPGGALTSIRSRSL